MSASSRSAWSAASDSVSKQKYAEGIFKIVIIDATMQLCVCVW